MSSYTHSIVAFVSNLIKTMYHTHLQVISVLQEYTPTRVSDKHFGTSFGLATFSPF